MVHRILIGRIEGHKRGAMAPVTCHPADNKHRHSPGRTNILRPVNVSSSYHHELQRWSFNRRRGLTHKDKRLIC